MMGFVPCATPQTFSRIVVLPALALPMIRMRKWGHRYRSWSTAKAAVSMSYFYQVVQRILVYWMLITCNPGHVDDLLEVSEWTI